MFEWISENIATLIVCAVLIALVAAVIVFMIRNRKKGRGSCPLNIRTFPDGNIEVPSGNSVFKI